MSVSVVVLVCCVWLREGVGLRLVEGAFRVVLGWGQRRCKVG